MSSASPRASPRWPEIKGRFRCLIAVALCVTACGGGDPALPSPIAPTSPDDGTSPPPVAIDPDPAPAPPGPPGILIGAGDIATCANNNDEATARLLDQHDGVVFTAGDNAYDDGSDREFADCYAPTWGRHLARTRPAPGNHEYETPGAAPYFGYFGANAGPSGQGYYSYDAGAWHIISLNSNISAREGSAQYEWLRADLEANPTRCAAAYWHHTVFSSGEHGNNSRMRSAWRLLQEHGAEIVLSGHDHDYERFGLQNADGQADAARGIRQFVVGTGGKGLDPFERIQPNSEVRDNTAFGVLKLTLRGESYDWEFIPIAGGRFRDMGSGVCR
jgi:hypothetical protein